LKYLIPVLVIVCLNLILVLDKPLTAVGISLVSLGGSIVLFISFLISRQPQDSSITTFKVFNFKS